RQSVVDVVHRLATVATVTFNCHSPFEGKCSSGLRKTTLLRIPTSKANDAPRLAGSPIVLSRVA
ncbi:MAG: hypothetical protein NXI32_31425, partial [bacterium]|nr:hypothetical protein [bacterium]